MGINDLETGLSAIYLRFVLRDFFGKMVPGAIFLLALSFAVAQSYGAVPLWHESSFFGWALLLGVAWIVGFALQATGELTRILRNEPKSVTRQAFYERLVALHILTRDDRTEALHGERLLVIKEACGNSAMAFLLADILLLVRALGVGADISSRSGALIVGIALAVGFVALLWMHHQHIQRHLEYIDALAKSGRGHK